MQRLIKPLLRLRVRWLLFLADHDLALLESQRMRVHADLADIHRERDALLLELVRLS